MREELTNLLPPDRQRIVARDYRIRFGVVIIALLIILTLAAAALLVPTYILLMMSVKTKEARLAEVKSTVPSTDEAVLSARIAALADNIVALKALASVPSASATVRAVLAVPRPGIRISGFTYAAAVEQTPGTIMISGTAAVRNALRDYQVALQSAPFITSADLPISAYAKDTDITFTITVTLAP